MSGSPTSWSLSQSSWPDPPLPGMSKYCLPVAEVTG
jgi:hypothetical protein